MLIPELNRHNVFAYPYGGGIMLYAPLVGIMAEATADEVMQLEVQMRSGRIDAAWECLFDHPIPVEGIVSVNETSELTILLNQMCNFSCKYCYSAKGREGTELDEKRLLAVINLFLAPSRGPLHGAFTYTLVWLPTVRYFPLVVSVSCGNRTWKWSFRSMC